MRIKGQTWSSTSKPTRKILSINFPFLKSLNQVNVLYYHGNSVLNNNSCYLKYCLESNIKVFQVNTILDDSENLVAELEHFPIKDTEKSVDKIQMEVDCHSGRKKKTISCMLWLYKTAFSTNTEVNVKGM